MSYLENMSKRRAPKKDSSVKNTAFKGKQYATPHKSNASDALKENTQQTETQKKAFTEEHKENWTEKYSKAAKNKERKGLRTNNNQNSNIHKNWSF